MFQVQVGNLLRPNLGSTSAKVPSTALGGAADVLKLIRKRRAVFPRDYTGEAVDRCLSSLTFAFRRHEQSRARDHSFS